MSNITIQGSVLFVTGASRPKGIGRALIEEAIRRGAQKIYATARQLSQLDDLVAMYPRVISPLELDVTNRQQIEDVAKKANDTQILINNAGFVHPSGCVFNYNEGTARQEIEINFFGPLHLMNAFAPSLLANPNAAIVNVSSIAGLYPSPAFATYSASKAALYSLTQAVRIELMPHSIPVFGVYPGPIDTDMTQNLDVAKGSTSTLATRVFEGMSQGRLDITTDPLSDHFENFLKPDLAAIEAVKREFEKRSA